MSPPKPILLQCAMEVECKLILETIANKTPRTINNYQFYEGTIANYPIVLSISQVGLINATSSLTLAIANYNPISIINLGLAGGTDKKLFTGDIIIAKSIININSYKTPIKKQGEGSNSLEWQLLTFLNDQEDYLTEEFSNPILINLANKLTFPKSYNVYQGRIGSGDVWNREVDRLLQLNKDYHILCEDMESIATYTIANQNHIPVIALKIISDNILTGEEYNRNISKNLQELTLQYLKIIIQFLKKGDLKL